MKKKASSLLKHVVAVLTAVVKAKTLALKTKTSAVKTRLVVYGLVHNKWTPGSAITHKIHAFVGAHHHHHNNSKGATLVGYGVDHGRAMPLRDEDRPPGNRTGDANHSHNDDDDDDDDDEDEYGGDDGDGDGYPDLRHSLFAEEEDDDDCTGSVIDLVRKGREEETEFRLEDEIDRAADAFIRRFHRQMRLQKQESFQRYRDMLDRSV